MTGRPPCGHADAASYLLLVLTMALFGSAFPGSKVLAGTVPPEVAALLRFAVGAVALMTWLLVTGRRIDFSAWAWVRVAVAGMLGVFGFNLLFFWGLHLAPSVDGSIIVPVLSPVITTAVSSLILESGASRARVLGLATGVAGAFLFLVAGTGLSGGERVLGDLVYVVAAATWSAYTLYSRRLLAGMDPIKVTALSTSLGALMLGVLAAPALPSVRWSQLPADVWLNVLYLGIVPTAIAYVLYYRSIQQVGPVNASTMMLLVPILGATGGIMLLHETMGAAQAVGALLMVAGMLRAIRDQPIRHREAAHGSDLPTSRRDS
jgi:drug/metabolite transporter (DMT)-like permease